MCELGWDSALLTMALTSGTGVSMPAFEPEEDILNIHFGAYYNIINCIKLNLL